MYEIIESVAGFEVASLMPEGYPYPEHFADEKCLVTVGLHLIT